MALSFYIKLNNNTLLSLYPSIYILLYTSFTLMVYFLSLLPNVYLVFFIKLTVIIRKTRLNRKQIRITLRFVYIKYKI